MIRRSYQHHCKAFLKVSYSSALVMFIIVERRSSVKSMTASCRVGVFARRCAKVSAGALVSLQMASREV